MMRLTQGEQKTGLWGGVLSALTGHSVWLCHSEGRGHGKNPMTLCGLAQEAALSPPVLAAAVPARGRGLALGRSPPPYKAISTPGKADLQERLLCLSLPG